MSRATLPLAGIRASGGPLHATALQLTGSGLNVMYGLNGAGKSCLLAALVEALSGIAGEFDALLFLGSLSDTVTGVWLSGALVVPAALDSIILVNSGLINSPDEQPEPEDLAFAHGLIDEGLIAVRAVGRSAPSWEAWACFDPQHPGILRDEWERSRDAVWRLRQSELEASRAEIDQALSDCLLLPFVRASVATSITRDDHCLLNPELPIEQLFPDDGLPIPAALLGHVSEPFPALVMRESSLGAQGVAISSDDRSVNLKPLQHAAKREQINEVIDPETLSISSLAHAWTEELAAHANALYRSLLLGAPQLDVTWTPVTEWLWSEPCSWSAAGRPLNHLSHAESRWARFATNLVCFDDGEAPMLVLLDEPEAALHRIAESHAAQGLAELALRGACVVAATHSPALLNRTEANVVHVARSGETTQTHRLDVAGRTNLSELGLAPSDLLGRLRNLLLVEWHHDELIFRGLIGERLDASYTELLTLGGGAKLKHIVESSFLFKFTDAKVIVVLDNLSAEHLRSVWKYALDIRERSGTEEAAKYVIENLPGRVNGQTHSENLYIREFLKAALELGQQNRIVPMGVSEPDIQHYLPVNFFVPSHSWGELYSTFQSEILGTDAIKRYKNYKGWLELEFGADFSDDVMKRAVESMSSVPPDIEAVANLCEC